MTIEQTIEITENGVLHLEILTNSFYILSLRNCSIPLRIYH